jgi:MFS family permease
MIGVSTGMSLVGRLSYLADVCKADERGRATSMVGGIQRVGALGGPILFSLLATSLGYSLVFAAMGVLALLNVVLVAAFVNYRSYPHREAVPAADIFRLIVEFRQVLLTAGSAGIVLMLLRTGRQTLFPIAGFALGLGLVEISLVFSVSMLIDMLLFYPAGLLMDKHGRKWAAVPGMLLLSISIFCLVIVPGLPGLWLFALISGIGNGITSGVLLTLATDLAPDTQRSQFIGIWRTQLDTGVVAAPALIGYLTDTVSLAVSALCISGLGLLGTCLLAFLVQETLVKEVPQTGTTG